MTKANRDGYFPYTPATTLLRGLRCLARPAARGGLENVFARHHRLAEACAGGVAAWGLKLCAKEPRWYSDTVSAIVVPPHIDTAPSSSTTPTTATACRLASASARSPAGCSASAIWAR